MKGLHKYLESHDLKGKLTLTFDGSSSSVKFMPYKNVASNMNSAYATRNGLDLNMFFLWLGIIQIKLAHISSTNPIQLW